MIPLLLLLAAEPDLRTRLLAECQTHFDARRAALGRLKTPADVMTRQKELRAKFVEALGGFPERTPLSARVVGTLERDGYTVEKVIYESRPGHHVTANFYRPAGKGPFPAVLMPIGHSVTGKAAEYVQRGCHVLVRNGIAALAYDPIGQGERRQLLTDKGLAAIPASTMEHTLVGVGALLVGTSTATYRVWDGMRGLDYLASRPDVDAKRLGCTGCSGGGTLTSYLMALDERIVAAAPSCYLTSLERLFATIGPQDAEQNITGQVAFGMDHADYIAMRAPRPTLVCAATGDFFDVGGTWAAFREAKRQYTLMGHPERLDILESNTTHGYPREHREGMARWMLRWLAGRDEAVVEREMPLEKDENLRCTRTGQVLDSLGGVSAFGLNARRARELAAARGPVTADAVAKRLGLTLPVAAAPFEPSEKAASVVVKAAGRALAVDLPWGGPGKSGPLGVDQREAWLALHLGRPLLTRRVHRLLAVIEQLKQDVELVGVGKGATVVLHAAALSPRVKAVRLERGLVSWRSVTETPLSVDQLTQAVPGALATYDLPDLIALVPGPVTVVDPADAAGTPLTEEAAKRVYGAMKNVTLSVSPR